MWPSGPPAGVGCDDVKICSSPAPASAPATKPEPEPAPPQAAAKPPTAKPTPAPAIAQAIDTPTQGIEQETSSKDVQFTYCPKDGCLPPTAEEGNCGAQIYQVIEGGATSYFKLCSYDCPDVNSICQGQDSNCSKYKCLVKITNGQYNVANTFMSRDAMISQLGHPICENLECYNPDAGKQHHMSQKQFNKMWNKAHHAHHCPGHFHSKSIKLLRKTMDIRSSSHQRRLAGNSSSRPPALPPSSAQPCDVSVPLAPELPRYRRPSVLPQQPTLPLPRDDWQ